MKDKKIPSVKIFAISFIAVIVFLFFLSTIESDSISLFVKTLQNQPILVLFFILSVLIASSIQGYVVKILVDFFSIKLSFREWISIAFLTEAGNYITPFRGGMILKATYLKKKHGFDYSKFLSIEASRRIVNFILFGFLGIITSIFIYVNGIFVPEPIFIIFAGTFVIGISITLIKSIGVHENKILNFFSKTVDGWNEIKKNKKLLTKLFLLDFVMSFVSGFRIYIIFLMFSHQISPIFAYSVGLITLISLVISIIPAGLGIKEAVFVYYAFLLGLSVETSIYIATIDRLFVMLIVFAFALPASYFLSKK